MNNIFLKNLKLKLPISIIVFLLVFFFVPIYFCYYPPCKSWQKICMPTKICTTIPFYQTIKVAGLSFDLVRALSYAGGIFLIIFVLVSLIIYFTFKNKKVS